MTSHLRWRMVLAGLSLKLMVSLHCFDSRLSRSIFSHRRRCYCCRKKESDVVVTLLSRNTRNVCVSVHRAVGTSVCDKSQRLPPLLSPRTSTDVVVWPKWLLSRSREDTHSASWTIIISWNNSKWSQPYALLPLCNIYEYLFVMQKCHLSCKPCNCHPVLVLTTSPFWSPCILLCWRNPPQSLWVSAATRCLRSADVTPPTPPSYVSVNKPAFEPHPSVHFLSLVGSSDLKTL